MDLNTIYPLIVPSTYYIAGTWDLPHQNFPNKDYILTWVFFKAESSMTYITRADFELLNANHTNWQQIAFENLRNSLDTEESFYTSFRISENDNKLSFLVFSNLDGIGSSRILLSYEFDQAFPEGYNVAMPDRSCGLIISNNLSSVEHKILEDVIKEYYGCTGTPMSSTVMQPSDFSLPSEWLLPLDNDLSSWMIEEMLSNNK